MSSTLLDSSVLWTRQRAEALSKALSSIMHVGLISTLTALKKPTSIWVTKISSIFQFWLSLYEGGSFVPQSEWVCVCLSRLPLEVCSWTKSLRFTHKSSQHSASWSVFPRVSHSFNEFFSCSPLQPRSLALQIHYFALTNLCVGVYV